MTIIEMLANYTGIPIVVFYGIAGFIVGQAMKQIHLIRKKKKTRF